MERGNVPVVVLADALGWQVAARREQEGDRYFAQLQRIRSIVDGITRESTAQEMDLAFDRIRDLTANVFCGGLDADA